MKIGSLIRLEKSEMFGTVVLVEHTYVLVYWMTMERYTWEFREDLVILCE